MKKQLLPFLLSLFLLGVGQTQLQAQNYPDKCVCVELMKKILDNEELQQSTNQKSDSVWSKYWSCSDMGSTFKIEHLLTNCASAYANNANRPMDSIVFIESWTNQDIINLEEMMAADDIRINQGCFDDLGCGSGGTGIDLSESSLAIVYPNPANNELKLSVVSAPVSQFVLLAMDGRAIEVSFEENGGIITLHTATIPSGFYLLKIQTGETWIHKKIIIEH
ncbi:MAG: T9SS type A sorting domain-containing protein [Bacteroidota bacterium]|nr:T9SS type A sorting domain-containing protein [Bacteroidota bacterium]MDX5429461.1 T9SS type A sorting domain-containing protein [Bacteroidota bacterium]MDX5468253.1 T9SS type A sorting domain-containing protein [Bacteroidota bacterium]